jgi:hypothetical protein
MVKNEVPDLRVIQIFLKARDLCNLDMGNDKSDSQVILKMKWLSNQKDWAEVDRTEVVLDSLNPSW